MYFTSFSQSLLALALPLAGYLVTACSGASTFGGIGGPKDTKSSEDARKETQSLSQEDQLSVARLNKMTFNEITKVNLLNAYEARLKSTTDQLTDINGLQFEEVHSFLKNNEANYRALAREYETFGNYFDAIGISGSQDLFIEEVAAGWKIISKAFETGRLEIHGSDSALRLQEVKGGYTTENGRNVNDITIGIGNNVQPGQEIHIDQNAYAALLAPDSLAGQAGAQTVNNFTLNIAPNMPPGSKLVLDLPMDGGKNIVCNQGTFSQNIKSDGRQMTWTFLVDSH